MEHTSETRAPVVAVLMSTYNGARYLKEQIDSILGQEGVSVRLIVRDDGSTDDTPTLLRTLQANGTLTLLPFDRNLGYAESFWTLVLNAPTADYYAYADQDDVWLPGKLARAVEWHAIHAERPCLYAANVWRVDQSLKRLPDQDPVLSTNGFRCENYIVRRIDALGHTMVWNRKLQTLLQRAPDCIWASEHDNRLQFAAAMLGEFYIDPERVTLHRIHGKNASGDRRNARLDFFRMRLQQISRRLFGDAVHRHSMEYRARSFLRYFGDQVDPSLQAALRLTADYRKSPAATLRLLRSDVCNNAPRKVRLRILLHLL